MILGQLFIFTGLKPETKYKIRMMAITAERGNGRPSGWMSVTTLADAPRVGKTIFEVQI